MIYKRGSIRRAERKLTGIYEPKLTLTSDDFLADLHGEMSCGFDSTLPQICCRFVRSEFKEDRLVPAS